MKSPPAPSLFREPPLLLLWVGQLLSSLGDQLHEVALMWIAVQAVGARAGLVVVAGTVARLVFGLIGGVFADRWNRRVAMVASDLLRAAAVATLAIAGLFGTPALAHLAAVAAILGILDSLFAPSLQASLPALTSDRSLLQRANALFNINHRLARMIGPSLTGFLLAWIPISQLFSIDAASFCASALTIVALGRGYAWRPRNRDASQGNASGRRRVAREIGIGLSRVRAHPVLPWALGLLGCWNLVSGAAFVVGLPLWVRDVLGSGPEGYGYILGTYGAGNVVANLIFVRLSARKHPACVFGGGAIFGLGFCALAWAPSVAWALPIAALAALGGPLTDLTVLAMIQTDFEPEQIGRVYSLRITNSRVWRGVGLIGAGPLFAGIGVRGGIALAGATLVLVACAGLARFGLAARVERQKCLGAPGTPH